MSKIRLLWHISQIRYISNFNTVFYILSPLLKQYHNKKNRIWKNFGGGGGGGRPVRPPLNPPLGWMDDVTLTCNILTWTWCLTHRCLMGYICAKYEANPSNRHRTMATRQEQERQGRWCIFDTGWSHWIDYLVKEDMIKVAWPGSNQIILVSGLKIVAKSQ